eukprot:Lithocolla_globosa_v1_NODE_1737_length_2368_cov_6.677182.p2 type:complete len:200 gc:universal NODE_1737_length_2368_cov_6.677182:1044-1643(+)
MKDYARQHGLPYGQLTNYDDNREVMLKEVIDRYDIEKIATSIGDESARGVAKELFIRLLYLGDIFFWKQQWGIDVAIPDLPFIEAIKTEIDPIADFMYNNNEEIKKIPKKNHLPLKYQSSRSEKARVVAIINQSSEREILEVKYMYYKAKKLANYFVFAHDGSMSCFPGLSDAEKQTMLRDIEKHVEFVTGFKIKQVIF